MFEPYPPTTVKKLILGILDPKNPGIVSFTKHAYDEMAQDNLIETDCINTMRAGVAQPGELRDGTWRYQVRTTRIGVVTAFRSERHVVVVTAWRRK